MARFATPTTVEGRAQGVARGAGEGHESQGPGRGGGAGRRGSLHPHFLKEEEYALPPLGLLAKVAAGPVTPDMQDVLAMTDRLKAELPAMLAEHRSVVAALRKPAAAARRARQPQIVHFTEKLMLHAQSEELVLYPAAILVGEHVRARLSK